MMMLKCYFSAHSTLYKTVDGTQQ